MRQFEAPRSRMLAVLHTCGAMTAKELSSSLAVDESNVRRILRQLMRDGLVQQAGHQQNGGRPAALFVNLLTAARPLPLDA